MIDKDAIKALTEAESISAASTAVEIGLVQNNGALALPEDFKLHDLEPYLPSRRRMRGSMTTTTANDFGAYVKKNAEAGAMVFVDKNNMHAVAVLNLGTTDAPGHCDNKATFKAERTAAYHALLSFVGANARKQVEVAEFFEDWADLLAFRNDSGEVPLAKAIGAVRNLTIEASKKLNATEGNLSATRSTFESVQATSEDPIPTYVTFTTEPYFGLQSRAFVLRVSILTTGEKPLLSLRIIKQEQHDEEMAQELAELVRGVVDEGFPVAIGTFSASS